MIKIELTQGYVAIIDAEDLPRVNSHSWKIEHAPRTHYAVRNRWDKIAKRYVLDRLHRIIMDAKPGQIVDHKDGDGLNCRKSNLRFSNHQENQRNKKPNQRTASGFKGVTFREGCPNNPWVARIGTKQKRKFLGYFGSANDAAKAYNLAAVQMFGEFANLNHVV